MTFVVYTKPVDGPREIILVRDDDPARWTWWLTQSDCLMLVLV
jgi:hypothetical protein